MQRLRLVTPLLVILSLLTACQPSPTQVAPTAVPTEPATATAPPPTVTAAPPTVTAPPATETAPPPTATLAPESTATAAAVPATSVRIDSPLGLAFDADGKLYVSVSAEMADVQILQIDPSGLLKLYAGLGQGFDGDGGPALSAQFGYLGGLAFDRAGDLYIADLGNNRIRRIDQNGMVSTVAGNGPIHGASGSFGGDGGPAASAQLWYPSDIAFDRDGNLFIADSGNNRIRKVDQQGVITTVVGDGTSGFGGDGGPATAAQLKTGALWGVAIAFDAAGNLYIADGGNARVRMVNAKGIITTIAGTGESGFSGDRGPATAAKLSRPSGLAFDAAGNLYIADSGSLSFSPGSRVRKVDKAGKITTVAGIGDGDFTGDGGPATAAALDNPAGLAFDSKGNLYIADSSNDRVRKVDQDGIITTVVGGHF